MDDLTSTVQVIALDAKIQVDFNPNVVAYYHPVRYGNRDVADQDFRNDAVDAGEIGIGTSATVQFRWEDPDTHQVTKFNGNFNTWELAQRFEDTDPRYQLVEQTCRLSSVLWDES